MKLVLRFLSSKVLVNSKLSGPSIWWDVMVEDLESEFRWKKSWSHLRRLVLVSLCLLLSSRTSVSDSKLSSFSPTGDWVDTLWAALDCVVETDFPDVRKIAAIHSKTTELSTSSPERTIRKESRSSDVTLKSTDLKERRASLLLWRLGTKSPATWS